MRERLDEAERGDRLAGAGRVLEPEALGRRWGPRAPRRAVLVVVATARSSQSCGSSGSSSSSSSSSPGMPTDASGTASLAVAAPLPLPLRCAPRRAARSACPTARRPGGRRARCRRRAAARPAQSSRSSPSSSDQWRRQATRRDLGAGVELGERGVERARGAGVPGASADAASSPSSRNGSRVNARGALDLVGSEGQAWPRRPLAWFQPWNGCSRVGSGGPRLAYGDAPDGTRGRELQAPRSAFPSVVLPAS